MKHNLKPYNVPDAMPIPVRFEYTHPTAIAVCVAGTFNDWQPESRKLRSSGVGDWWREMAPAPGTYEYCLIVDGQWMPDLRARQTVPNPFGGRNSILEVACDAVVRHVADVADLLLKNANKSKAGKQSKPHGFG